MPLVNLTSNVEIAQNRKNSLLKQLSTATSECLGKSENYVMVMIRTEQNMLFSGTGDATAFLEFKSIGLPEDRTGELSQKLCQLIGTALEIPQNRIYIEFSNANRHLWGWDGKTF